MAAPSLNSQLYMSGSNSEDSSDPILISNNSIVNLNQFNGSAPLYYSIPTSYSNSYLPVSEQLLSNEQTPSLISEQLNYSSHFLTPVSMQPFNYTEPCLDTASNINQNFFNSTPQVTTESYNLFQENVNSWVYSSSGFDLLGILSKVITRPFPQINIGPVDMSCAFLVVDARIYDFPIIYSSDSFEKLTGYNKSDIAGKNCRFLQSPDGLVTLGSRRRYTDNNAVHQIKSHMVRAKETQVSIVNYKKNGQPFVNLITIIPVFMGESIAFYVGFQVDLVEQPNSIMDKMKDGTYSVNYSSLTLPTYLGSNLDDNYQKLTLTSQQQDNFYEQITGKSGAEDSHIELNKLLIENSEFIHVLTLKGVFLYVSPSSLDLFGYPNNALMGHSISKICHPNDMVPIMRELKESVSSSDHSFNLTYRVRRTTGEYVWMESVGKLHSDSIKGKRFMVLNGRVRPSCTLLRSAVTSVEPFHPEEFWCKLSSEGLFLYVSKACASSIGFTADELIGTSIYSLALPDYTAFLTQSLQQSQSNEISHIVLGIEGKSSRPNLTCTFYPGRDLDRFIICRFRPITPNFSTSSSSSPNSFESVYSGSPPSSFNKAEFENLLDRIDPNHPTTWQYEIHQLQIANNKLRQEIDTLSTKISATASKKAKRKHRTKSLICHACNRTESPEWRRGPNGPKTLCNPCGIKYAKKISTTRKVSNTSISQPVYQASSFSML